MTRQPFSIQPRWRTVSASVRGSSHQAKNAPNEDAVETVVQSDLTVIAVADGHGSERSPRSEQGSRIAARVAIAAASAAVADLDRPDAGPAARRLGERIVAEWRSQVRRELERVPLTETELADVGDAPPEYAYGTTILVAGSTTRCGFAVQLGDGHIMCVAADGTGRLVFDEKPGKAATETDSLCMIDAERAVLSRAWPLDGTHPVIVAASTDGFGDAFEDRRWFEDTGRQLHRFLTDQGIDHVQRELPSWLQRPADEYGDDTSLALLVDVAALGLTAHGDLASEPTTSPSSRTEPDAIVKAADTDASPAEPVRRHGVWPFAAGALAVGVVAGIVAGSVLFGGHDVSPVQLWTGAGLIEVDGDDARLVMLPAEVDAGPSAVYADDAVWVIRNGTLIRIDGNGAELRVNPSAAVGELAALAVDGGRVLAAAASAAAVIPIDTGRCETLCEPDGCIPVVGAETSPCDAAGDEPADRTTEAGTTNPVATTVDSTTAGTEPPATTTSEPPAPETTTTAPEGGLVGN